MKNNTIFYCWACEKTLHSMHEIAQGVCDTCKAAIIRKNQLPLMHEDLITILSSARTFTPNTEELRKFYIKHHPH